MIDLAPDHLAIVEQILAEQVPDCEVRAYGSRVTWTAQDYSDLDLAVVGDGRLDWTTRGRLTEAFEASSLPIRVDVLDWHSTPARFQDEINRAYVVVQQGPGAQAWRDTTFGECARLIRDTVSPSPTGDLPYIGLQHVGEGTLALLSHGIERDVTSEKSRFSHGDVLFGKLRPYFSKVVLAPFDGICSTDIWVVRAREGVDQEFLFYSMASPSFVEFATLGSEGTRMPRAQWDHVSRYKLKLPPFEEQHTIGHVLRTLDDKIELNRRIGETLEEMAQALFKSWFVDFDPVRAKVEGRWQPGESLPWLPAHLYDLFPNRFVDSELGDIPKGWVAQSLDQIADFTNGLALQRFPPVGDEWLPVIKIAEMRRGYTDKTGKASVSISPRYIVEDGDVLFSWSGSLELVLWWNGRGALNQHLFKVTSEQYPRWFYWGWTREYLADFRAIAAGKATTMGHIRRQHLTDAKVAVPPSHVLQASDALLSALLRLRVDHSVQNRGLADMRNALLPKLVSGDLRVPNHDRTASLVVSASAE